MEIEQKYIFTKKLSEGGFGKVYLGTDKYTKQEVVLKLNSSTEINDHEFKIMKDISGVDGFPRVMSSGMVKNMPYIILEKLGLSLKDIMKKN